MLYTKRLSHTIRTGISMATMTVLDCQTQRDWEATESTTSIKHTTLEQRERNKQGFELIVNETTGSALYMSIRYETQSVILLERLQSDNSAIDRENWE